MARQSATERRERRERVRKMNRARGRVLATVFAFTRGEATVDAVVDAGREYNQTVLEAFAPSGFHLARRVKLPTMGGIC